MDQGVEPSGPIEIWVDHRENPKVVKKLRELEHVELTELQLPVGDVIIPSAGVAIERKAIGDFIASVYDGGKVFRQLEEIRVNYPRPYLIVHGNVFEHLSWTRGNAYQAHITYLSGIAAVAKMGIPVVPALSDEEYLHIILALAKQFDPNRPAFQRPIETRKSADRTLQEEQEDTLAAIRGIGRKAAKKLLEEFRSPLGVFQATEEQLVALDGIGGKTAKHLKEVGSNDYGV